MDLERNQNCVVITQETIKFQKLKLWLKYLATFVISKEQRKQVYFGINNKTWMHLPIFIVFVVILQISIYTYYKISLSEANEQTLSEKYSNYGLQVCFNGALLRSYGLRQEIWRFFTHAFLQTGKYRLLKNLSIKILFGIPQEVAFSFIHIIPLYAGGIVFTALFLNAISSTLVLNCGSSPGEFALVFAQISNLIVNYNDIPFNHIQAILIFIYVFSELGEYFYYSYPLKIIHNPYVYSAIYGIIYGLCILCYKQELLRWRTARIIILSIFFSCLAVAIVKFSFVDVHK